MSLFKLSIYKRAAYTLHRLRAVWLINFPWTWGEQRTPGAWRRIQFSSCLRKKPTNFGSRWTVCELFADGAAQVRSPIHRYAHLVHKPFTSGLWTIRRTCVYEALSILFVCNFDALKCVSHLQYSTQFFVMMI